MRNVIRFRRRSIWIHWLHSLSFIVLLGTGTIMFFHLIEVGEESQIRLIHKIAAATFVLIPLFFAILEPKAVKKFLGEAFRWGKDDVTWLKAASSYYFGGREHLPPQGYINGGQRLWQFIVFISGQVFAGTGIVLWFYKFKISTEWYQWILLIHDLAFIAVALMFLVHIYLGILHPRFKESFISMLDGKISESYAREHFAKWFDKKSAD